MPAASVARADAVSTSIGEQAVRPMPLSMQAGPDGRPLEGFLPGSTCEVDGVWIGNTDGRTAHRLSAGIRAAGDPQ